MAKKTMREALREFFNTNVEVDEVETPVEQEELEPEAELEDEPEAEVTPNTQKPKPAQKPKTPKSESQGDNLVWLNSLIKDLGGPDAFKALLVGAVSAVEMSQNQQKAEKEVLIAALVANSAGQYTAEELDEFELPALQKLAKIIAPAQLIDYRPLSAQGLQVNKGEDAPVMPAFLLAKNAEKVGEEE